MGRGTVTERAYDTTLISQHADEQSQKRRSQDDHSHYSNRNDCA